MLTGLFPFLWRSELANVPGTCVRNERLRLAKATGCSAYDCEFVALALNLGVKLVSVDQSLIESLPETGVPLEQFAESGS